jgi:cell cycle sensor histidine kinase DivJ
LREAVWWHAGWALALILAAFALLFINQGVPNPVWAAIAVGLAPSLGVLTLKPGDGHQSRLALLAIWAAMSVLACGLTGGIAGPLAVWCLSPLAAAAVLGGSRPLAQGACLSFAAFALTGLAQAANLVAPLPSGAVGFFLALLGLTTNILSLAAALLLSRRRHWATRLASRVWPPPWPRPIGADSAGRPSPWPPTTPSGSRSIFAVSAPIS